MFEQDFVMRQIEQLIQALNNVIFLKKEKRFDEALRSIHANLDNIIGKDIQTFNDYSFEEVLDFFQNNSHFKADLALATADLLREEGIISELKNDTEHAKECFGGALLLYKKALKNPEVAMPLDLPQNIIKLEKKIEGTQLLQIILKKLNQR